MRIEGVSVRNSGVHRSENVGISNIYTCENHVHRISKGSWGRIVLPGLVDPKSRPQEVYPMENTVDIP